MTDDDGIKALARKCARGNLNYAQAKAVFDTLYAADAIVLAGGNQRKAAARAGVIPTTFYRMLKRGRAQD